MNRLTTLLGIFNHIQRSSVFHTSTGILELGFSVNVATQLVGERVDADQRRAADRTGEALHGRFGGRRGCGKSALEQGWGEYSWAHGV